jgi:hypothetical protein
VIAERVEALRVPGAPVRRSGLARTYETARDRERPPTAVREGTERFAQLQTSLPDTMEYWADPGDDGHPDRPDPGAFRYLTALRQSPPGIKSFG